MSLPPSTPIYFISHSQLHAAALGLQSNQLVHIFPQVRCTDSMQAVTKWSHPTLCVLQLENRETSVETRVDDSLQPTAELHPLSSGESRDSMVISQILSSRSKPDSFIGQQAPEVQVLSY